MSQQRHMHAHALPNPHQHQHPHPHAHNQQSQGQSTSTSAGSSFVPPPNPINVHPSLAQRIAVIAAQYPGHFNLNQEATSMQPMHHQSHHQQQVSPRSKPSLLLGYHNHSSSQSSQTASNAKQQQQQHQQQQIHAHHVTSAAHAHMLNMHQHSTSSSSSTDHVIDREVPMSVSVSSGTPAPVTPSKQQEKSNAGAYVPQVEAISPTPEDQRETSNLQESKDRILSEITKIDKEIASTQYQCDTLRKRQSEIAAQQQQNLTGEPEPVQHSSMTLAEKIYAKNRVSH